jgi:polyferredoxin
MNRLLQKWYFPIVFKYISLFAYIFLIAVGLSATSSDTAFLKELRNTNLGNLIVWSYWWPAIIIGAIFFGRIWCMVCPVELITTFFAKIGLKRKRPKWLLSGWAITIFYILILFVGIQGFAIHRNPAYMAIYLLVIVGVSILVGSIYEKNTFCRYVCPVGDLLGLYSRLSFLGWRVKNKNVCDTCKDKSCIHRKYQYNLNCKSCGVDLYPAKIEDNAHCILCAGCLKTCGNYQQEPNSNRPNPQLTRIGFASNLFKLKPFIMAEIVFVLIVSGFVISEIWSEWGITNKFLNFFPNIVNQRFAISNKFITGFIKGSIIFVLVPFVIWLIPFLVSRAAGHSIRLIDYLLNYGIASIPIMAAAHLDKAILKTTSRIPYFEYLLDDVTGLSTAQKILDKEIVLLGTPVWVNFLVSILLTLVMVAGIWLSMKVVNKLNGKADKTITGKPFYLIPFIYGGIFLVMIVSWRWFK